LKYNYYISSILQYYCDISMILRAVYLVIYISLFYTLLFYYVQIRLNTINSKDRFLSDFKTRYWREDISQCTSFFFMTKLVFAICISN